VTVRARIHASDDPAAASSRDQHFVPSFSFHVAEKPESRRRNGAGSTSLKLSPRGLSSARSRELACS